MGQEYSPDGAAMANSRNQMSGLVGYWQSEAEFFDIIMAGAYVHMKTCGQKKQRMQRGGINVPFSHWKHERRRVSLPRVCFGTAAFQFVCK